MSPSKSKSKDKKAGKDPHKASLKSSGPGNMATGSSPLSGYNPLLGKFHTIETAPFSSAASLQVNGRFRNIDETDDNSGGSSGGNGVEYDNVSNNGSWSGESEDHKDKASNNSLRQEALPGADSDKREKIRQKNERKHQRQKERRAQELHERCSGFLMSRKLEALAQQLVSMGFSQERATMALILNEGKIEESVAWLFEGAEDAADAQKEHNLDGCNLKIDISDELARIADMEIRYKCSRQEVERAIVACEGDLLKAAESLRTLKQDSPSASPKPGETDDAQTPSSGLLSLPASQNSLRIQPKPIPSTTSSQQKRDEKDFNYTKTVVTNGAAMEPGSKNVHMLRKVQPSKLEWAKAQQIVMPTADKRWPTAATNPSISYSLASPLQATPPAAKTEARCIALGSELKNLQLGSVKEPVIVMQRPQSANVKLASTSSISSSPPNGGPASGWYLNNVEVVKPNGFSSHAIPSTRTITSHNILSSSNQLYSQLHYQHHPQFMSTNNGMVDSPGASRGGNGVWSRMGSSPTLAVASSLGLFTGVGPNGSSGSSSPVDWKTGGLMGQLDYANIDWSLDRSSRPSGTWTPNNAHLANDSYTPGLSSWTAMRPVAMANGHGGAGAGVAGLQDGGLVASSGETSAGLREWSSPFEEKDIFSLPRQFVSSPL